MEPITWLVIAAIAGWFAGLVMKGGYRLAGAALFVGLAPLLTHRTVRA